MLLVAAVLCLAVVAVAGLAWFARHRGRAAALAFAVVALLAVVVGARVAGQPARIQGSAMAPTLRSEDRVFVNRLAYWNDAPRRGDIVMLHYPPNPSRLFVMRIIGEEGDRIQMRSGRVLINGAVLDESYLRPENRGAQDWGPGVIPQGHYFVMGDNRTNSSDSRHWGYVPRRHIVGKIAARWWPGADARMY